MIYSSQREPGNARCPTCGRNFETLKTPVMPFCSVRCQQIDLGRWFDEEIGLPVEPELEESDGEGFASLD